MDIKYTRFNEKYEVTLTYSLNSLMMVMCTMRLITVLKFYLVNSKFYTPQSKRICDMSKVENTLSFSLKASMQGNSYEIYGLLFLLFAVFYCISIRNFEMVLDAKTEIIYSSYSNVIWSIVITMLTVGYGDYYPSTLEGRLLSISSALTGVCLISMLIVSMTNMLNFVGNEKDVFEMLVRLEYKDSQNTFSAELITGYLKLYKAIKKREPNESMKEKLRDGFLVSLLQYEENSKLIINSFPSVTALETFNTELEFLDNHLNSVPFTEKDIIDELDKVINLYED